jgi:hypothetical protein
MNSFKNAFASANDAGGSIGISSCTVGDWTSVDCGTLLWCRASMFDPSTVTDERRADASGSDWTESFRGAEGRDLSNKIALVGRVLLGFRFGASKRLIFGWRSHLGLRITFGDPVGFRGGGLLEESVRLVTEGGAIWRGGCGEGTTGIGGGEDGAENRDDGESRALLALASPRVGVTGYEISQ